MAEEKQNRRSTKKKKRKEKKTKIGWKNGHLSYQMELSSG